MANFKVGDKVRCIKVSMNGYPGIPGKVYEVRDVDNNSIHGDHIYLITDEPCGNLGCQSERFELVTQDQLDAALAVVAGDIDFYVVRENTEGEYSSIGGENKGYVPDKIDWDKHKQYMRNL